jgi:DNA-binding XRE family transcriptional regulator
MKASGRGCGLGKIGQIDDITMKNIENLCLPDVPEYTPEKIVLIRKKSKLSQAALASVFNISPSTVKKLTSDPYPFFHQGLEQCQNIRQLLPQIRISDMFEQQQYHTACNSPFDLIIGEPVQVIQFKTEIRDVPGKVFHRTCE